MATGRGLVKKSAISDVVQAADKYDMKVFLADPVPDPMQVHVCGL